MYQKRPKMPSRVVPAHVPLDFHRPTFGVKPIKGERQDSFTTLNKMGFINLSE